jgi:protein-tyrosine phosphatase
MSNLLERRLAIAGTYNVRDLGGYSCGSGQTQWRRIWRADGLHRVPPEGAAQLFDAGVRTVIDLRHGHELEDAPNPFRNHPEVDYIAIPMFDQLVPPGVADATAERRSDVLFVLYCMALEERQDAILKVLTTIAHAREGAVLFHCTGGKDRTGIIAALILAVADVETASIVADFALTKIAIAPMVEKILAEATAHGKDVTSWIPFLGCEAQTMQSMLEYIHEKYVSVTDYLRRIGMDAQTIERLRLRLVGTATPVASA